MGANSSLAWPLQRQEEQAAALGARRLWGDLCSHVWAAMSHITRQVNRGLSVGGLLLGCLPREWRWLSLSVGKTSGALQ